MTECGRILEFPTGRSIDASRARAPETVARLVRTFSGRTRAVVGRMSQPLPIELVALAGIDDETVKGLAALAAEGVLTAATAARLALRHAAETFQAAHRSGRRGTEGRYPELTTTLAGDVFGDFAFRLRRYDRWLGFANLPAIPYLYEICPPDRNSLCLLIGSDAARRNVVRVSSPQDWRTRLADLHSKADERSEHHVLLIGGLPPAGAERRSILDQLYRGLTAAGSIAVARNNSKSAPADRRCRSGPGIEVLMLIEIAMPGLVERDRDTRGGSR